MGEPIRFTLDGVEVSVDVDPKASTLSVLRDTLGVLTGKAGCSPQGLCGCCTALIEGKPRLTCTLPVKSLAGKAVTTMAGVDEAVRSRIVDAFVASGASQCGYCTPGIVLSTAAWLSGRDSATQAPTADDVHRILGPHTCRCTGYVAIAEGIRVAAGSTLLPTAAGTDAGALVTGERPFVGDLVREGMLYGAIVLAPVVTGVLERIEFPELAGARAIPLKAAGDQILHAGDIIAAIAADSWAEARALAKATVVRVTPAAVEVGAVARGRRVTGTLGDVAAESDISIAASDPVFLEPECALAVPDGEAIVVYSAGHDAVATASALSAGVGVPVRVILVPSGGSYGGKDAPTVELAAALLAREIERPVRVSVSLEEGMRLHPRRPAVVGSASIVGTDGHLSGLHLRLHFDGGQAPLAATKLVDGALGALAWDVENLDVEVTVNRSASPSAGAIRGSGCLGVTLAIDRAMAASGLHGVPRSLTGRRVWDAFGRPEASLAVCPGGTPARVVLRVVSAEEVEVQCNVPDFGTGRDAALISALTRVTGLPSEVFAIAWASSDVVGTGGEGPVEQAAERAGLALRAAGGALARRVGRRFVGVSDPAPSGWAAARVALTAEGVVDEIEVMVAVGAQEAEDARRVAEGAAHMGLGIALSEEVTAVDGVPESRFRFLGLIREKLTPAIRVRTVAVGGPARDVADATVAAVVSAIVRAVSPEVVALPLKTSPAARGVGVRIR